MSEGGQRGFAVGIAAICAAALIWGFNYIPTKIALGEMDPLTLQLVRVAGAVPLYLLLLRLRGVRIGQLMGHWREALPLAALAILGDQLLFLFGLSHTTTSHAAMMYILVPLVVPILAFFLIGERVGLLRVAGIAVAFCGAFVLVSEEGLTFESRYLAGDLMVLAAAVCWACYVVLSKPLVEKIGAIRTTSLVFILALPLVLPFTLPAALAHDWGRVTPLGAASVASVIVGATFLGYICYLSALKRLPASAVAPFSYTVPIIVAVLSTWLLHEVLTANFYSAAALIFAGLVLVQIGRARDGRMLNKAAAQTGGPPVDSKSMMPRRPPGAP